MKCEKTASKTERLIFVLKKFYAGYKYSVKELQKELYREFGESISLRTMQRDLRELLNAEPLLTETKSGRKRIWKVDRFSANFTGGIRIESSELLSFYFLKAYLRTFKNTVIEEEARKLEDKIEQYAPASVISDESLYWDKNIGTYDYTQYDYLIRRAINYITNKKLAKVKYKSKKVGRPKEYSVLPRCLFTYAGALYAVAYVPKHDTNIALAIHRISELKEVGDYTEPIPEFDFVQWAENRFGVYYGKPENVRLRVDKTCADYFRNRFWHHSQKLYLDKLGNLLIDLKVPIVPDFKAWILSWGDKIKVLKPTRLKKEINYELRKTLKQYE